MSDHGWCFDCFYNNDGTCHRNPAITLYSEDYPVGEEQTRQTAQNPIKL